MTTLLIFGGLALLVIIAVLTGVSLVDRESRRHAWRRIAAERRRNHEQRQWLRDAAHRTPCARCPYQDESPAARSGVQHAVRPAPPYPTPRAGARVSTSPAPSAGVQHRGHRVTDRG